MRPCHHPPYHHPNEEWLISYGAGTLDEAYSLLVASHLAYCGQCRDKVRLAEDLGGVLIGDLPGTAVGADALDRIMARLDADEGGAEPVRAPTRAKQANQDIRLPSPLLDFVGGDLDSLAWKTIGPGVRAVRIPVAGRDDSRLWILRAAPGTRLPEHGHRGSELTLVVKGCYAVGESTFVAGDLEDVDDDKWHRPTVGDEEECICVVATEAPLRLKGVFARLFQPLIGL
jgi:putative transcriptional regulator